MLDPGVSDEEDEEEEEGEEEAEEGDLGFESDEPDDGSMMMASMAAQRHVSPPFLPLLLWSMASLSLPSSRLADLDLSTHTVAHTHTHTQVPYGPR